MREVKLVNIATGQSYVLTDDERKDFKRELSRTQPWRSLRTLWHYLIGKDKYIPPRIAPDVQVLVILSSGATREYRIYGRTVLHNVATSRNRQFYMGILLVEWVS